MTPPERAKANPGGRHGGGGKGREEGGAGQVKDGASECEVEGLFIEPGVGRGYLFRYLF